MVCPKCGKEIKETDKFCGRCGNTLFINDNIDVGAYTTVEDISSNGRPTQRTPSSQIRTGNRTSIDGIYLFFIIIPSIVAAFMLIGEIGNGEKPTNVSPQIVMAEEKLREIENEISTTTHWINEKEKELKQVLSDLTDPGPEPEWWQFIEHPKWKMKKEAYDFTIKKIELGKADFRNKVEALKNLQNNKAYWIALRESLIHQGQSMFKYLWNNYIQRVLHFLLILSIMLFSLNRFCRFILIKEYLGVKRV